MVAVQILSETDKVRKVFSDLCRRLYVFRNFFLAHIIHIIGSRRQIILLNISVTFRHNYLPSSLKCLHFRDSKFTTHFSWIFSYVCNKQSEPASRLIRKVMKSYLSCLDVQMIIRTLCKRHAGA